MWIRIKNTRVNLDKVESYEVTSAQVLIFCLPSRTNIRFDFSSEEELKKAVWVVDKSLGFHNSDGEIDASQ